MPGGRLFRKGADSMPIYEYQCLACGKRFSLLAPLAKAGDKPACPKCSGTKTEKLMSRFSSVRSDESRMERLADPSALGGLDENDPASVAKWAKKMGREMGEDLGDDFEQEVDQAMENESGGGVDEIE
jgi:putative FmdB family regulatory protein